MALRIISGVPGSGKTYFAVHHALTTFAKWSEKKDEWILNSDSTVLITNIDSLKVGRQLSAELAEVGDEFDEKTIEKYFNCDFLSERFEGKKVVFIIDEAQGIFHYKFFSKTVFLYFQKHRHYAHDVYLVTQDPNHLAKGLRNLAEYHIQAAKRTMSFFGEFRYKFVDPTSGQSWKTKVLKRDPRIFAVYKSMVGTEVEKMPSVPRRYAALIVVMIIGVVFGFNYFLKVFFHRSKTPEASASVKDEKKKNPENSGKPVAQAAAVPAVTSTSQNKYVVVPPAANGVGWLLGTYTIDGDKRVLVDVGSTTLRVTMEQLTGLCRCHAEDLFIGQPFNLYLPTLPQGSGRSAANERSLHKSFEASPGNQSSR